MKNKEANKRIEKSIKGSFEEIKLMREGKVPERTMEDLYKQIEKWKSVAHGATRN